MSIPVVHETLGISEASLYRLFERGELPVVHVGGRRLVDPSDLRAYIERNKRTRVPTNDDDRARTRSAVTTSADAGDGYDEA